MKIYLLFLLILTTTSANAFPNVHKTVRHNQQGFPICFSKNKEVYFFIWDQVIQTSTKLVRYVELKEYTQTTGHRLSGCSEVQYLQTVPAEILKPLNSETKNIFPEEILFALNQVAHGAHEFTFEKTSSQYIQNRLSFFTPDSPQVLTHLRYQVGDKSAQDIIQTWSHSLFSKPQKSCDAFIGTCDFYLCQEEKNPCGLDGYNLGFGYKYCSGSKFELLPQMPTPAGQSWVKNVFKCLQQKNFTESLVDSTKKTCESIHRTSIGSHPDCYVEAGFCNLSAKERFLIFELIKSEIFSSDMVKQGLRVLQLCQGKDSL